MDEESHQVVQELHSDLARKYKKHAAAIQQAWRSFTKGQRAECMKVGARDGIVLKHSLDASLGNVCKFIPEWNLRDVAESGPDFLLDLLKHRATTSLPQQYAAGQSGGPGDHGLIMNMMATRNLRHVDAFKNSYTFFLEADMYGKSFVIKDEFEQTLADFRPAIEAGVCVPQSTGELILMRQIYLLQSLTIIIDDILEEGSKTRVTKERAKKPDQAATAALAKLNIAPTPKLSLSDLVATARDQQDSLEEYLGLLSTEPVVLAFAVNTRFFTRPELLPDEKGRRLPVHTDKYVSASFFETIHASIQAAAIWRYISRLLQLLDTAPPKNKAYRAMILQEIANVCHLEYTRAQGFLKRQVQAQSVGKYFRRVSNAVDTAGNARVTIKKNWEDLTRSDPLLHYILRLVQADTTAPKAITWVKKLGELYELSPDQRERLDDSEFYALSDFIVVASFLNDLSSVVSVPSISRKTGQTFITQSQKLESELNTLKANVDLRDFVVPIDNLLEPGVTELALKSLDDFVVGAVGKKLGFLYFDLVEDCVADILERYEELKAKREQEAKKKDEAKPPVSQPVTEEPVPEPAEQPKIKVKTRPATSRLYDLASTTEDELQRQRPSRRKNSVSVPRQSRPFRQYSLKLSHAAPSAGLRSRHPWRRWASPWCPSLGLSIPFSRLKPWR